MKIPNAIHCPGLLAALILVSLPTLTQARDPGINQPGAYGGRAGVGVAPGVGAGRPNVPAAAAGGAGGPASGIGIRPGAGAGRVGTPSAAGGVGGAASGIGVRPGAGAGRAGVGR